MSFLQTHHRFIVICFAFHLLYLYSIFDIYFRSPLSQSIPEQPNKSITSNDQGGGSAPPLSKRVVVFIGDGLRADKAFLPSLAPYLNSLCPTPSNEGTIHHSNSSIDSQKSTSICGVSHTRVPTESRPGHLAVFAGFYEDVSAVLTGWQANTTPFDHVFSKAKYGWAIGVPEIVTLFQDNYKSDLRSVKRGVDWSKERRDEPIDQDSPSISILHYSSHQTDFAAEDARSLDQWSLDRFNELLQSTNQEVQRRLNQDQLVVFIHLIGLDINGHAHGPHSLEYHRNIQFVDTGIKQTVTRVQEYYKDDQTTFIFTADHGMSDAGTHGDGHPTCTQTPFIAWGAGIKGEDGGDDVSPNTTMINIEQASITPLISSLLGTRIPVHSVGVLTKDLIASLNTTPENRHDILLSNHDQLLAAYKALEHEWQSKEGPVLFRPYKLLSNNNDIYERIDSILMGSRYYHKYDWKLMRGMVTVGYITWSLYCLIHGQMVVNTPTNKLLRSINYILASILAFYLFYRQAEWRLFLYAAFPFFFIDRIFARLGSLSFPLPFNNGDSITIPLTLLGLEVIVQTYYHRWTLGVAFLVLGLLRRDSSYLFISVFPFLPLVQSINQGFLLTSCFIASLLIFPSSHVHSVITMVCTVLSMHSDYMLSTKQGLPIFNQLAAWTIVGASILSAVRVSLHSSDKSRGGGTTNLTMQVVVRLLPAMVLLSVSYEPLFLLSLARSLASLQSHSTSQLESATTLLLLLTASFFGLGNIASLAHFSLPSAFRFVTVFSPFTMTGLLLLKIVLPLSLLSTYTSDAGKGHEVRTLILSLCDYITLRHFYSVTDTGSWLDIGASISRFVIAGALVVLVTVLLR